VPAYAVIQREFAGLPTKVFLYCTVVSLTRGSWALFPLVTETLWADSRAVTCRPEDGRLTFGEWVVVVKKLKPMATPYTNGLIIT